MTFSWIVNSRINTIIFVLLATLQITSCTTEDVQEILANINENTQTQNTTSLLTDSSYNGNDAPTIDSNTSGTNSGNTSNANEGSSNSGNSNTGDPTATIAMYSYSSDLSDPSPLSGATLDRTTVYMFFTNTSDYSNMTFYCCKGLTGDSKGEPHNASVTDSSETFVYEIDLSQYTTTGTRELYVDATRVDGNAGDRPDFFIANFTIAVTTQATSTTPPPPTTPPVVSDVSLSWVAPFEREDNNPISPAEIAGYKIYYGTSQGNYTSSININDGSIDSYTVENLVAGTYYFVITTRDTDGRESAYSPVVTKSI